MVNPFSRGPTPGAPRFPDFCGNLQTVWATFFQKQGGSQVFLLGFEVSLFFLILINNFLIINQ